MWFRVDDGYHDHLKVLTAGNSALGLWSRLGSYCGDQLTDGFVPEAVVKAYGTRGEIQRLLLVGMLERGTHPTHGPGYVLHDYLEYNPTRNQVLAERARAAERKRASRARHEAPGQYELPLDDDSGHGVTHSSPTRPDPTRPVVLTSVERLTTDARGAESSSVDDALKLAAAGIALRSGHSPTARYAAGVAANLRAERLHELEGLVASRPILEAVTELVGSKIHARAAFKALNISPNGDRP